MRGKLIETGLPEGAVNYVLRKAQNNEWLLKNLVRLISSKYFLEDVHNRLAIVLALVRNPHRYNYLNLKTTGEEEKNEQTQNVRNQNTVKLQLTRQQLEYLANIRAVLEKSQHLDKLIELVKTDYFSKKVRNKAAFMIAFLDCPDRFEFPDRENKQKVNSTTSRKKHEKIMHETRPAETYTSNVTSTKSCELLYDDRDEDDIFEFFGIPKPASA